MSPGSDRARRGLLLALGAVVGTALWTGWAHVLARGSPLDGGVPYLGSLFVTGLISGIADATDHWPGPVGLYLGQALGMAWDAWRSTAIPRHGEALPLGLLFLLSVNLAVALGVATSAGARIWLEAPPRPGPD